MSQRLVPQRLAALVLAILSAAVVTAVYHSSVFSHFSPIRLDVVSTELHASRGALVIALPDLSSLRGHTPVLSLRLRNWGPETKQIGIVRDGFPRSRVVAPPDSTIVWNIVLSPQVVRALEVGNGDSQRSLEVTGNASGWSLTAGEVRNYYVRLGDRPMVAVLPRGANLYTAGAGFVPAAIAICLLALVNALARSKLPAGSLRSTANGLALLALLVCLACLLLPRISTYKLLLSPTAFLLVAAALLSPALLYLLFAIPTLVVRLFAVARRSPALVSLMIGAMTHRAAGVARYWKSHEVTFERGAALLGIGAIAIAQPIFEVVSNSPEFFPARSTPPATALAAVLAICFGVPLALLGLERAIRLVSRRSAAVFHGIALTLLSAAIVMPWFRRNEVLMWPWDAPTSLLIGLGVALGYGRFGIVRQFLTALAPAALVVPALFLLDPRVRQNFQASESGAALQTIEQTPPIVFVVFDELPLNSLLHSGGSLDAERYPNFATLSRDAYWFPNASTVAYTTSYAVPAILSGRYTTTESAVPTLRYYPVNLFTALARHYDIFASLRFQQLCPPRACEEKAALPGDTVQSLLSDLGLVWLHIALPLRITEELPPVVGEWAEFGRTRETPAAPTRGSRASAFAQFVSSIDGRPAHLHFIHLVLPHMPFEYVSSGHRYRGPDNQATTYKGRGLFEGVSAAYADTLHQRHLEQVGYADRLVGDVIKRLREVEAYDKSLVIITADHGASYREGLDRRQPRPTHHNLSDILQVPLLIKLPGQERGEVVDRIVETVDIFPTILDVLGADSLLRVDGHSLIDSQVPKRRSFFLRNRSNRTPRVLGDLSADRAASLERKERRFGRGDHSGFYAPPNARHLLGTMVSQSALRASSDVQITISNPRQFESVKRDRDLLPLYVRGLLSTSRSNPLSVVVVVNGIIAAVTESYRDRDGHMFGSLIPESALQDGDNTVAAFVVDRMPVTAMPGP